jgi:hypothetical protein
VSSTVTLDGSGSFDPDGQIVSYQWSLASAPTGSTATLVSTTSAITTFFPDVQGAYVAHLTVTDNDGATDVDDVNIVVNAPAFVADAGPDQTAQWLTRVHLAGVTSGDPDFPSTFAWAVLAKPAGANVTLEQADTLAPNFLADAVGTYTFSLTVTSQFGLDVDQVSIVVTAASVRVGDYGNVTYVRGSNQLIYPTPNVASSLTVLDLSSGTTASINLAPDNPSIVSSDPSGQRAIVKLDKQGASSIDVVDLTTRAITRRIDGLDIYTNIAFGSDNRIYFGNASGDLVTYDIVTDVAQTRHDWTLQGIGNRYRLLTTRDGSRMYLQDSSFKEQLVTYDLSTSPLTLVREDEVDLQEFSDPELSDDDSELLFPDGQRIQIKPTGFTLAAPVTPRPDAVAKSSPRGEYATLTQLPDETMIYGGMQLRLLDSSSLVSRFTAVVPKIGTQFLQPEWVHYNPNGTELYIVGTENFSSLTYLFVVTPP